MVDLGADVCLAFMNPGSKGTKNCVDKAIKAGIEVKLFYPQTGVGKKIVSMKRVPHYGFEKLSRSKDETL